MRRALVNDVVHSFCYCCRNKTPDWPFVLTGFRLAPTTYNSIRPEVFAPFIAYSLHCWAGNYITAQRNTILLASWLRAFDAEEQAYAVTLLERYHYGNLTQYRAVYSSRYGSASIGQQPASPSNVECID